MDTDTYTDRIRQFCTAFKLPTVGTEAVPRFQQAGHGEALETLLEVLELEAEDRQQRRTTRLRRASRLAPGKTWDTFQHQRLPARLQQQLGELAQGEFIEQGTNVLAFGLPGTGKTHALCALGHRLVETGYSVLFTPAYRLVQELLAAQRDLQLPRALRKLDNFDFLVLDDLGYLPLGCQPHDGIDSRIVKASWKAIFRFAQPPFRQHTSVRPGPPPAQLPCLPRPCFERPWPCPIGLRPLALARIASRCLLTAD